MALTATAHTSRALLTLVLVAAVLVAAPACASAASLVYVKDFNVWISNPDGTGAYQVTRDGSASNAYTHPSMTDAGLIVAAAPNHTIVELRQNGDIERTFPVPLGFQDPEVSPDGARITMTAERNACGVSSLACQTPIVLGIDGTQTLVIRGGGYGPAFMADGRVAYQYASYLWFDTSGTETQWFVPAAVGSDAGPQPKDPAFSRTGNLLAVAANAAELQVYRASGPPPTRAPTAPPETCSLINPTVAFSEPTFSPDGATLAWAEGDGIWSVGIGSGDCPGNGWSDPILRVPGATQPSFSAADVNPGPRTPAPTPTPTPTPAPTPTPSGSGSGSSSTQADDTAPVLSGLTVRKGSLHLTVSKAVSLRIVIKRRGRTGAYTTLRATTVKVSTGEGSVPLGKLRSGRYRLSITATDVGGRSTASTVRFTV